MSCYQTAITRAISASNYKANVPFTCDDVRGFLCPRTDRHRLHLAAPPAAPPIDALAKSDGFSASTTPRRPSHSCEV